MKILDRITSRRAFMRNLLASNLALGASPFALHTASLGRGPGSPAAEAGVPSLDELSGDWLPMSSLGSYPALSNCVGSVQVTDDMLGVKHLTFPPYSQLQDTGTLSINGRRLRATDSRWFAYQILRRNRSAGLNVESSTRMVHEQRGILFRLSLENLQTTPQEVEISADLTGLIGKFETGWDWALPAPKDASEFKADRAGQGDMLLIRHSRSAARVAFAFVQKPARLEVQANHGRATWRVPLNPSQSRTLEFVMVVADEDGLATHLAGQWAGEFEKTFDAAKALWERLFSDVFRPGNNRFSGNLPLLTTPDEAIRRIYYMSILSSELLLLRTNLPLQSRVYVTAEPQYAVTLTYFWDAAMVPVLTALLDPRMMREQLKRWLTMNVYTCYAQDAYSGQGRGPWYSANDVSLFGMLQTYLQVTGDREFLKEKAGDKTVIEHLRQFATHGKQLARKNSALADYGKADNLLECVPTYIHAVASLNAANVGMMRAFADLREWEGDGNEAAQLREEAKQLATAVLGLYVPGRGVWTCLQPDGKRLEVRHVYDFIMAGRWMAEDLSPSMRSEMVRFVQQELMTKTWMRALSLHDAAAAQSDRPDHGPMGAYDAWPPLTLAAMIRFGYQKDALEALHRFASVTREGPFSQSHELLGRGYDVRTRVAERGLQTTHELCGGAFADVIISSFFGFQPDFAGRRPVVDAATPRGFAGKLAGLRWQGKLYTLASNARGVSLQAQ